MKASRFPFADRQPSDQNASAIQKESRWFIAPGRAGAACRIMQHPSVFNMAGQMAGSFPKRPKNRFKTKMDGGVGVSLASVQARAGKSNCAGISVS